MDTTDTQCETCHKGAAGDSPISPCTAACPIGTKAAEYIRHISKGEYEKAWDAILEDNPFPMSCGLVCHHPCEVYCRAGQIGEPIAIRALKRFVAEFARAKGLTGKWVNPKATGKRVAVVGAGPAGLTAAYYLRKKGHAVTVFEASDKIGGMLASAIPEYRLPDENLAFDLENIKAAGMEIKTNVALGMNFTVQNLKDEYDAVFIAYGANRNLRLKIEGEDSAGVIPALEFLRMAKEGKGAKPGARVAVLGGGNLAVDAARTALRLGATSVNIYYRRRHEDMPAYSWEIAQAEEEGIVIHARLTPIRISDDAGAKKITFHNGVSLFNEKGHFAPVLDADSPVYATADIVIVAIGNTPDSLIDQKDLPIHIETWGGITVNPETLATTVAGVFAGGDCVSGAASLVEAITAGKVAADSIDKFLLGKRLKRRYIPWFSPAKVQRRETFTPETFTGKRIPLRHAPAKERVRDFREIEPVYSDEDAVLEAKRCLGCDLKPKEETRVRRFVQFMSLFIFNAYIPGWFLTFAKKQAMIYQGQIKSICIPGLHCYSCPSAIVSCPVGSFQFWLNNTKYNFRAGSYDLIGLYVVGFLGMVGAAVGRAACGWLCPFGLFQDLMYKIPTPIKLRIPKFLRFLKYAVLLITVILLPLLLVDEYGIGLGPWFCKTICPSGTLVAGIPLVSADAKLRDQLHIYWPIKMTILIFFLLWMVLSKRAFCRTTCPLGAFWSFFNRVSILRVRVDSLKCEDCNSCRAVCPVDINPPTEINTGECIRCMNCLNACSVNSMHLEVAGFEPTSALFDKLKKEQP